MNARNPSRHALPLSLLSLALFAGGALAQSSLDTRTLAPTSLRTMSCGQVDIGWNLELIEQYPHIPAACHEVVINNGSKWARFEANFLRINRDGSVTSEFVSPRGEPLGRYTLIPAEGQQVTLDGRKVPFSALRANQRISLYVPEGAAALASEPMAVPAQYSRISSYVPSTPAEMPPEPVQLADATPPPSSMARLPDTAGPLPWLAVAGLVSALGALGLRRRPR